ncbi:hypothetical protein JCM10213_006971 [Rhodosporidiobolus nylandii]
MNGKVLFILTSHKTLLSGQPTGWFLPEAAHPYFRLKEAGYTVEFASPKARLPFFSRTRGNRLTCKGGQGGNPPCDPASITKYRDDEESVKFLVETETREKVQNSIKLEDVKIKDYIAIDLPQNPHMQALVLSFLGAGKPVASVCQGPAALVDVVDKKTGTKVVEGKKPGQPSPSAPVQVTCFSNEEEEQYGTVKEIPFLLESALSSSGADFVNKRAPFAEEVVRDGLLLTGGNPASAREVGVQLVRMLQEGV